MVNHPFWSIFTTAPDAKPLRKPPRRHDEFHGPRGVAEGAGRSPPVKLGPDVWRSWLSYDHFWLVVWNIFMMIMMIIMINKLWLWIYFNRQHDDYDEWLVVWNMTFIFPYTSIGNVIIPTDEVIFFRGVGSTTNQLYFFWTSGNHMKSWWSWCGLCPFFFGSNVKREDLWTEFWIAPATAWFHLVQSWTCSGSVACGSPQKPWTEQWLEKKPGLIIGDYTIQFFLGRIRIHQGKSS